MNKRISLSLLCALTVLLAPFPSEAQFLDKLSKGLEKINKGLDKMKDTDNNKKGSPGKSPSQSPSTTGQPSPPFSENGWKKGEIANNQPFLTPGTKYLKAPYNAVSDISDGVFAVKRSGKYEFWRVDGTKLFAAEWEGVAENMSEMPLFSHGVTAAKRAGTDGRICLLYLDGHIRECDPSWEKVSMFCDGIAMVKANVNHKPVYFFIDTSGRKIYPQLKVYANRYGSLAARPLKDGLRAVPSTIQNDYTQAWGYIDRQGNVKITPKYKEARDFSEGYALVELDGTMQFINTSGKVVWNTGESSYTRISDVCDGIVYIEHGSKVDYYDPSGKLLASFSEGNAFYDGKAFVKEEGKQNVTLIDTRFHPLRSIYWKILPPSDVTQFKPVFHPYGLATVNAKSIILDPEGNVVLEDYDGHNGNQIGGFGQFAASGYCLGTSVSLNGALCSALIRPSGEIVWLFSDDSTAAGPYRKLPPIRPIPIEPVDPIEPGDSIPVSIPAPPVDSLFTIKVIKWDMEPVGPTNVEPVKYKVAVAANPKEGGIVNISPVGSFGYGDYATVTASANEGWAVGYVSTSAKGSNPPQAGIPFPVTADQTLTVHFIKKDEDKKPDNIGSFQGSVSLKIDDEISYSIPVYLQLSDDGSTPYGPDTYGFMSVMFDPTQRYTDKNHAFAISLYAAPLKVCGVQTDPTSGRKWLVLDGGSVSAHDLKINPGGGGIYGMLMNMMIGFDGFSSVNSKPRHYRVEMCDFDAKTGEFTAGMLETFLPSAGGWVSGNDTRLHDTRNGMFGSFTDKGYPADFLKGVRFSKAAARNDIQWYPPESWSQNKNAYQQLMEAMGAAYRTARSDYYRMFE